MNSPAQGSIWTAPLGLLHVADIPPTPWTGLLYVYHFPALPPQRGPQTHPTLHPGWTQLSPRTFPNISALQLEYPSFISPHWKVLSPSADAWHMLPGRMRYRKDHFFLHLLSACLPWLASEGEGNWWLSSFTATLSEPLSPLEEWTQCQTCSGVSGLPAGLLGYTGSRNGSVSKRVIWRIWFVPPRGCGIALCGYAVRLSLRNALKPQRGKNGPWLSFPLGVSPKLWLVMLGEKLLLQWSHISFIKLSPHTLYSNDFHRFCDLIHQREGTSC